MPTPEKRRSRREAGSDTIDYHDDLGGNPTANGGGGGGGGDALPDSPPWGRLFRLEIDALRECRASDFEARVFMTLVVFVDERDECRVSEPSIAALVGCSRGRVHRAMRQLERRGLVVGSRPSRRAAKRYRLTPLETTESRGQSARLGRAKSGPSRAKSGPSRASRSAREQEQGHVVRPVLHTERSHRECARCGGSGVWLDEADVAHRCTHDEEEVA